MKMFTCFQKVTAVIMFVRYIIFQNNHFPSVGWKLH